MAMEEACPDPQNGRYVAQVDQKRCFHVRTVTEIQYLRKPLKNG